MTQIIMIDHDNHKNLCSTDQTGAVRSKNGQIQKNKHTTIITEMMNKINWISR